MKKFLIVFATWVLVNSLHCQNPGDLDVTFNSDGKLSTDIDSHGDDGRGVAIQPDGKIVIAGRSDFNLALVRYNIDGSLDNSFSSDGKVTTAVNGLDDRLHSVTIQSDGKIVAAGYTYLGGSERDFVVVRYNSDGSLDNSFDTDGVVTTDIENTNDYGRSVAIQPDGRIVVAGYAGFDFCAVRYNSDGSLDNTFGSGGIVVTDMGTSSDICLDVKIQLDGKILLSGISGDFAMLRYNADGSLDNTFDSDGKVYTSFGASVDIGAKMALQPDGKILMTGSLDNGPGDRD